MERLKIATSYSSDFLEIERPQPLSDNYIESLINDVLSGKLDRDISESIFESFKIEMSDWLANSKLNRIVGLERFKRLDIINGCTQFIDNLYMQGPVQTVRGDYRYHERLNLGSINDVGSLTPNVPLLIAMPFPQTGSCHAKMQDILTECQRKNIPIHIDGAWVTCCKSIDFSFDNPIIHSVGISLSKGLGLGWNRIGLRWSNITAADSISIMNDFRMNNKALVMIARYFLKNLSPDYLWNKHYKRYMKVCNDFNLEPTKSIYLALREGNPVGVSPLIRYLENND